MTPQTLALATLVALGLSTPAFAQHASHAGHDHHETREHGAHEHGAARLDVALAGTTLEMQLDGAAYNFVGFERAAEGPAEVARVEQARLLLNNASALFGWEAAAGCTPQAARVDATLPAAEAADDHDHDAGNAHDHDHGHTAHGNWRSYHRFECSHPDALGAIEVRLFQHFPELKHIDFQLVTDTTQNGGRLEPGQSVIRLTP